MNINESPKVIIDLDKLLILHVDDNPDDVFFVKKTLEQDRVSTEVVHAKSREEYLAAIEQNLPDVILADHGLPGFSSDNALQIARDKCPEVPFIIVSGNLDSSVVKNSLKDGAFEFVPKNQLWRLTPILRHIQFATELRRNILQLEQHNRAMKRLVEAVQELSLARGLDTIMAIVRTVARELTGADGATFVLREGDKCYYAEENAISPLWKGMRFPMSDCISGWVMLNKQSANIEDIYADPRIPADAYKPTFVKSLVMVPIRTEAPIGAIGNYWAKTHHATDTEVELLQTLANTTAVAMESVQIYTELENRVKTRTMQLEVANRELEAFSYSVSHDLRSPLRIIGGYAHILLEEHQAALNGQGRRYLDRINSETGKMADLIEDLLLLSKYSRIALNKEKVNLSDMVNDLMAHIRADSPERLAEIRIQDDIEAFCDASLARIMLDNLLSNAWKYSSIRDKTIIEFGTMVQTDGSAQFYIRDNGAGFDMRYADKLFVPFQRLHSADEFSGTGIGLATVQRIIHRHGGEIRAEAAINEGATFFFTLPQTG